LGKKIRSICFFTTVYKSTNVMEAKLYNSDIHQYVKNFILIFFVACKISI